MQFKGRADIQSRLHTLRRVAPWNQYEGTSSAVASDVASPFADERASCADERAKAREILAASVFRHFGGFSLPLPRAERERSLPTNAFGPRAGPIRNRTHSRDRACPASACSTCCTSCTS